MRFISRVRIVLQLDQLFTVKQLSWTLPPINDELFFFLYIYDMIYDVINPGLMTHPRVIKTKTSDRFIFMWDNVGSGT